MPWQLWRCRPTSWFKRSLHQWPSMS